MAEILVRDIDPAFIERLRERARRNQRSLEAEAKRILEDAAPPEPSDDPKKGNNLLDAQTNLEQIVTALRQLGGEAQAKDIKDLVTLNCGGRPRQYKSDHSYRETLQALIEAHCPQSENWLKAAVRRPELFDRVDRGRYRLRRG